MARIRLELPSQFSFSTEMEVRIGDVNYGGHLGNDSLISLLHEARLRLLAVHGWTELDVCGFGLIMTDSVVLYKSESFRGNRLCIRVTIGDVHRLGFDVFYHVVKTDSEKEVARAKTGMVFFEYVKRKMVPAPPEFLKKFPVSLKENRQQKALEPEKQTARARLVEWKEEQDTLKNIRTLVFVQEQNVPIGIELDGNDPECFHVLVRDDAGNGIGTARMQKDGHIGRVAVLKAWRSNGVGKRLMRILLDLAKERQMKMVYLNAQAPVVEFYEKLGFTKIGDLFYEANIPHYRMEKNTAG